MFADMTRAASETAEIVCFPFRRLPPCDGLPEGFELLGTVLNRVLRGLAERAPAPADAETRESGRRSDTDSSSGFPTDPRPVGKKGPLEQVKVRQLQRELPCAQPGEGDISGSDNQGFG